MTQYNNLLALAKTSVDNTYDYFEIANTSTGAVRKILAAGFFPTMSTTGTSSEDIFVNITNKNQLNFKGIKSADTTKLTATTDSNNILLTLVESGIDLANCSNTSAGFLTSMDFTGAVTGQCPVVNGGTGLETIAKGAMLYASADDTIAATSVMSTNGQVLIGNATTGIPTLATLTAGAGVTITNGAGSISIAATISKSEANIDLRNAADDTTYNIDLDSNRGWISGNGTDEGLTVDADGKVFVGEDTPTAHFNEALNIKGGIRFSNDTAPTIKPNATTGGTAGQKVTIEGGSSASGNAGDLQIGGGSASSGGGNGGAVAIYGGNESGGTPGSIRNYVYDGSGNAVGATTISGGSSAPDLSIDNGNLHIVGATKGIVHGGSGTVTQGTNHSTGVTLNTTSGIITLAGVALAAGAEADFAVTNSTVQTDSMILLTVQSPAASSATDNATLIAQLDEVNDGSFNVRLSNPGAATTSTNAHKIHFLVINNS